MNKLLQWILSLLQAKIVKNNTNNNPESLPLSAVSATMPILTATSPVTSTLPIKSTIDLSKWHLVPELEQKAKIFLQKCLEAGYDLKITQGLRTLAQQTELYSHGRNGDIRPIVTNTMQSKHLTGHAFDICFNGKVAYHSDEKLWKAIADIGVSCGLTAGYYFKTFKDRPHFEIK